MRRRLLIAAILLLLLAPFILLGFVLYTPAGLALVAGQLWRLERAGVHITGVSGTLSVPLRDAVMPPSTRPPRFLPQFLRIDVEKVVLNHVRYEHTNGMVIEAGRAEGRATITARTLRVLQGRAVEGRLDALPLDAAGDLTLRAGKPFRMEGNATGHLKMSDGVVLALDGTAKGD